MFSFKCLPLRVASARAFVIPAALGIPSRCDAFFKICRRDFWGASFPQQKCEKKRSALCTSLNFVLACYESLVITTHPKYTGRGASVEENWNSLPGFCPLLCLSLTSYCLYRTNVLRYHNAHTSSIVSPRWILVVAQIFLLVQSWGQNSSINLVRDFSRPHTGGKGYFSKHKELLFLNISHGSWYGPYTARIPIEANTPRKKTKCRFGWRNQQRKLYTTDKQETPRRHTPTIWRNCIWSHLKCHPPHNTQLMHSHYRLSYFAVSTSVEWCTFRLQNWRAQRGSLYTLCILGLCRLSKTVYTMRDPYIFNFLYAWHLFSIQYQNPVVLFSGRRFVCWILSLCLKQWGLIN